MNNINDFIVPSEKILQYTAGVFDGEGSLTIAHSHHDANAKREWYYTLQLSICNTNYEVLKWIADNWKLGNVNKHATDKRTDCHRKQSWHWLLATQKALFVLDNIYPYLIVKKSEALIGIVFQNLKIQEHAKHGKLTTDLCIEQERLLRELLLNNRQGDFNKINSKIEEILNMNTLQDSSPVSVLATR